MKGGGGGGGGNHAVRMRGWGAKRRGKEMMGDEVDSSVGEKEWGYIEGRWVGCQKKAWA